MSQKGHKSEREKPPGKFLTPQEAAYAKQVSRTTIYSAIAEGRLPAMRILGHLAIQAADLAAWTPTRFAGRKRGFTNSPETKARMSEARQRWWRAKRGT